MDGRKEGREGEREGIKEIKRKQSERTCFYMKCWLVDLTEFQENKAICAAFLIEYSELKHKGKKLFLLK